jgi:hypothetical protein
MKESKVIVISHPINWERSYEQETGFLTSVNGGNEME